MTRAVASAAVLLAAAALAGCGPGAPQAKHAGGAATLAPEPSPAGPTMSGVGVVAASDLKTVVIDHETVEGGLAAGRTTFRAYADVVADAPLEPGSRIAFSYRDWKPAPVLVELKAR